jgi:hypothetical protein
MDLFTGPVGQANVSQQVHDYSPGVSANGLFWIVTVPPEAVTFQFDKPEASVIVDNLALSDAHDLKNSLLGGPTVPATVSFEIRWFDKLARAKIVNEAEDFTGEFLQTMATIKWSASQTGFEFVSEDPNPARNIYSVVGHERNGVFFHNRR